MAVRQLGRAVAGAAGTGAFLGIGLVIFAGPYLVYRVFPLQAYRWTELLAVLALLLSVIFLLLAIAKPLRGAAATVLTVSSFVVAGFLWVWSVIIVGSDWGLGVLYFVNMFLGVGTIISAFAAALFSAQWGVLAQLLVIAAIIAGLRIGGLALAEKSE